MIFLPVVIVVVVTGLLKLKLGKLVSSDICTVACLPPDLSSDDASKIYQITRDKNN